MAGPNADNNDNEPEGGNMAGNTEPSLDDPSGENNPSGAALPAATIPWQKLILIGCLGGFALFLQVTVWTLEMQIGDSTLNRKSSTSTLGKSKTSHRQRTIQSTTPLARSDLYLSRASGLYLADSGRSDHVIPKTLWDQIHPRLVEEQAVLPFEDHMVLPVAEEWPRDSKNLNATTTVKLLQQAADQGHPMAQWLVGNAYASGIWPLVGEPVLESNLTIQDSWMDPGNKQQTAAWMYWHMAAVQGNLHASMTLAARYEFMGQQQEQQSGGSSSPFRTTSQSMCQRRLPYLAAAAHGLMDMLETDPQSRAKVLPAKDRHILYQVHLHGAGSTNALDADQRPDEAPESIQFYEIHSSERDPNTGMATPHAAQAAFSLGKMHQTGHRGVPQNLTLAAEYYELAAEASHWEAAGLVGTQYLWGIGVEADAVKAHRFFRMGMPFGVEGCERNWKEKLKRANKAPDPLMSETEEIYACDPGCLNGMGLLRLVGVPMTTDVNTDLAQTLFRLAKDQGNVDAAYNLAMMKLGWKTHFVALKSLHSDGQSVVADALFAQQDKKFAPTAAEYSSILTDLTTAATMGHLQARHRLGLFYENGVLVPSGGKFKSVVATDCEKAAKNYQWIVENASPPRLHRLRTAYKLYVAGDWTHSLRHYLAAAEMGSDLGMVNAAFLLELGVCGSLSTKACAQAAVRLYKAAATKGAHEASLRVGDFYYYGRLSSRETDGRSLPAPVGPFGWVQYILFPEDYVPEFLTIGKAWLADQIQKFLSSEEKDKDRTSADIARENQLCVAGGDADVDTCEAPVLAEEEHSSTLEDDLAMAAHYYRMAGDLSGSPRANFNLGFLYQWGLGVKQDFPLAKRHYDLAISAAPQEATLPVSIALQGLQLHQYVVKLVMWYQDRWDPVDGESSSQDANSPTSSESVPARAERSEAGRPVPSEASLPTKRRTKMDVILEHLLSWESVLILALTVVLSILIRHRNTQR